MTNFRITVTSDAVCPWCYVGRKQLQRAQQLWRERHRADTFTISYAPYQLNAAWPRGPASSLDKQRFYEERFGRARTGLMHERLSLVGRHLGIHFRYGGRTGNTRDAHRLVQLAKKYGNEVELRTVDGLFAAYFEQERDITAYETLSEVAVEAGIPAQDFERAIVDSDEGGREVDQLVKNARLQGVSAVPDHLIQDRFRVDGAQEPAAFLRVFEKIKALERGDCCSEEPGSDSD